MVTDPVIAPGQLAGLENPLLFDVRTGPSAQRDYAEGHLPGARFVDLDADLAAPVTDAARGGRHPLPDPVEFANLLGRWGLTPSSHVVIYDDQNGANAAARMWWMLRALGHERVQVLDGGLSAARAAGLALTTEPPDAALGSASHLAPHWQLPLATIDDVDAARGRADSLVIDARAAARYLGQAEPIDPIAGHIPGAANLPLTANLTAAGTFKAPEQLAALYGDLLAGRLPSHVIVHCGSGVTACHTLLAMDRAGFTGARLYVGSWGEWCRNPERPRAP